MANLTQLSIKWKSPNQPHPKVWMSKSKVKKMLNNFFDCKGIVCTKEVHHAMPELFSKSGSCTTTVLPHIQHFLFRRF
jgi:hypothetical protein